MVNVFITLLNVFFTIFNVYNVLGVFKIFLQRFFTSIVIIIVIANVTTMHGYQPAEQSVFLRPISMRRRHTPTWADEAANYRVGSATDLAIIRPITRRP